MSNKLPEWNVFVCGVAVCVTADPDKCEKCNVPKYARTIGRNGDLKHLEGRNANDVSKKAKCGRLH